MRVDGALRLGNMTCCGVRRGSIYRVLIQHGFELLGRLLDESLANAARGELFHPGGPGTRCLLDSPVVREISGVVRARLVDAGRLPASAIAVQAIAFDKTPGTNWKVAWHQDVMFPFSRPARSEGFMLPSRKGGVDYARPPVPVLEALLAVRLHLDDCDESNGPLRVSPGTHRRGLIRGADIAAVAAEHGEKICVAKSGDALLLKPLLLHASSPSERPTHRRVLHLVYHSGEAIAEPWHRAV